MTSESPLADRHIDRPIPLENSTDSAVPKPSTLLVVDDDEALRSMIAHVLRVSGYVVEEAPDGSVAIASYVQHHDSVRGIITDISMPVMDGRALIRAIRKIDRDAKIIATSGALSNECDPMAEELGADAFLAKPYTIEDLLHEIALVFGMRPRT